MISMALCFYAGDERLACSCLCRRLKNAKEEDFNMSYRGQIKVASANLSSEISPHTFESKN